MDISMYLLFFFLSAFFKGCATVFNFFIDCLESLMKEINISNINKTDCHDIAKILLKAALHTIALTLTIE
jgi:hypothetical protein